MLLVLIACFPADIKLLTLNDAIITHVTIWEEEL
jgi:hypothetical protein